LVQLNTPTRRLAEYDLPDDGPTTALDLTTPTGEPVGTLVYNDGGVDWTPTGEEGDPSLDAQEHAAEVLRLLRDFRAEGIDLPEAIKFIRNAYAGDYTERRGWPWPAAELAAVQRLRETQPVYPAPGRELAALALVSFDLVRVVVLGIDPYPNAEHATGLAFSVPADTSPLPPGVRNIGKATGGATGDLSAWAAQGVLLLNRALTFSPTNGKNVAGVHLPIWQSYTDRIIRTLDDRPAPPVFLLMGRKAQRVKPLIRHGAVVETVHPSAPGRQREFIERGAFREVNALLAEPVVDWSL
jgi:uracil-DNA glycosylase